MNNTKKLSSKNIHKIKLREKRLKALEKKLKSNIFKRKKSNG